MALVDPSRPLPLIADALGLQFERVAEDRLQPRPTDGGAVVVRLVPYTLPPRYRDWATTADASAAVLGAAEELSDQHGLDPSWLMPHPSGSSLEISIAQSPRHRDDAGGLLGGSARVVVDGAGVVGAALELKEPGLQAPDHDRRGWMSLHEVSDDLVEPVIAAAASVLHAGEVLGRCWCQIDLVGLSRAFLLEGQGNREPGAWVPSGVDLVLPADAEAVRSAGRRATYAYARSAGVPAWDAPIPPMTA
jgi:hypothetical protein